ncbi:hypothetical protein Tsubulata_005079 [Turnera subulata]|uniref:TCP domain-containing protein n=1 Tax=Turnera subulata TaxID=218843 RepID=A0A9Q0FKM6_9ROSI|nr:hypothetical protein Tsubulata_005079 [Turnera subulata]
MMFLSTNSASSMYLPQFSPYPLDFYDPAMNDQYSTTDVLLYQYHNSPTIPLIPTNPSLTEARLTNTLMSKLDLNNTLNGDQHSSLSYYNTPTERPVLKKDKHSKIYTASGFRDRRVRLSIEISRKFFDLQDMLGFDKASKTLDWLLTKSRKAIRALAAESSSCAKSLSSSSACEVVSESEGLVEGNPSKTESLPADSVLPGERKMKQVQKSVGPNLLGRESRVKARARAREKARERARVKMTSRTLQEPRNCADHGCHYCFNQVPRSLDHYSSGRHNMASSPKKLVSLEVERSTYHSQAKQMPDPIPNFHDELDVWKRKLMTPTIGMDYQQINPEMTSKGLTCNINGNNNQNFPSLPQVWDINPAVAQPSIPAPTNINLSTGTVEQA